VRTARFAVAHVPGLVLSGSKPRRDIQAAGGAEVRAALCGALRSFEGAVGYPPHQVVLGTLAPEALREIPRPWHLQPVAGARPEGHAPAPLDVEGAKLLLKHALKEANKQVFAASRIPGSKRRGMGCTAEAVYIDGRNIVVGHVGDSRAYLLRDGRLRQLSEDHSLVAQLLRDGAITEEEAVRSPQRHEIVRALGLEPSVQPHISRKGLPLRADDALVLCSDGLSDLVDDETIAMIVARSPPTEACRELLNRALTAGGMDNISVGIFSLRPLLTRLGQPDGISPSRMAEMLEVDKAGPKVRC